MLVRGVLPTTPAAETLRRGDVLVELDGHAIANDGTFAVGGQARFRHPSRPAARQRRRPARTPIGLSLIHI